MHDVILHAFNWPYSTITQRAAEIAAAGYGAVLFPPPLYSDESGASWWQRYQPKDYRVLRSYLGRKAELVAAVEALKKAGVRAYADVVFNHMANEKKERSARHEDPYAFPGARELARYRAEAGEFGKDRLYGNLANGLFSGPDFHAEGDIQNWNDPWESEALWMNGLPDLEMTDWVVDQQCTCLRELVKLGFTGFRVDALKHLPVAQMMRVFTIDALDDKLVFGEVLTTNDRQEDTFLWPIIRHTEFPCYDFALHDTLRRAFSPSGTLRELVDPGAYGNALPWWRGVTFAVTHDLPLNEDFRGMMLGPQDEYLAHAYVLGRDGGVPLVYSDHNESAADHPMDRDRWSEAWRRYDVVQMVGFHNAVHGLPQRCLYEADGFVVFARGDRGLVAINKTDEWRSPTIWTWGLRHGRYRCQLHQHDMQVAGDQFTFAIPPRQAQLWLHAGS